MIRTDQTPYSRQLLMAIQAHHRLRWVVNMAMCVRSTTDVNGGGYNLSYTMPILCTGNLRHFR